MEVDLAVLTNGLIMPFLPDQTNDKRRVEKSDVRYARGAYSSPLRSSHPTPDVQPPCRMAASWRTRQWAARCFACPGEYVELCALFAV